MVNEARETDRILVFLIAQLGDTIAAVPVLQEIKRLTNGASLTLLTDRHVGKGYVGSWEIFEPMNLFDRMITYPVAPQARILWRVRALLSYPWLLLGLRKDRYQAVYYMIPFKRTRRQIRRDRIFFKLLGISRIVEVLPGYVDAADHKLRPLPRLPHTSQLLMKSLRMACNLDDPFIARDRIDLLITEEERALAKRWMAKAGVSEQGYRLVGVGPGSKMPAKRWPEDYYATLGQWLISRQHARLVVFGGPEDRSIGERLIARWGAGINACGEFSPRVACAALEKFDMFVGNDAGSIHLAASAGVPCVGVYSARDYPGLWEPYGSGHIVLRDHVECEGCMLKECHEHQNACLTSIGVTEVFDACRLILGRQLVEGVVPKITSIGASW